MSYVLSPAELAAKWIDSTCTEPAASEEHFIDLCRMLEVSTHNEVESTGEFYGFDKGAGKVEGGDGFADAWKRGYLAWKYTGMPAVAVSGCGGPGQPGQVC